MFSQISSSSKSHIHSKRELLHHSLATQDRSKIKKSIRFAKFTNLLINQNISNSQFIIDLQVQEIQATFNRMINDQQFVSLACCLIELENRPHIKKELGSIISSELMVKLVRTTQQMMYLPQITVIYQWLSSQSTQFHQIIFQHPQVIINITKEIQGMKSGTSQQIYLQILEQICPSYSKRYQHETNWLFNLIFELVERQSIALVPGVNILKSLSSFINQEITFHPVTIDRLLTEYERRMQDADGVDILEGIFLIMVKVIYYTQKTDIVSCWRILQLVLHASQTLKARVIHNYYNRHLLMAKVIQKMGHFELYQLSTSKVPQLMSLLIQQYKVDYLKPKYSSSFPVTTVLINHLLTHTCLLHSPQFSPDYLYLMLIIAKHSQIQTLENHFAQNHLIDFLTDCIDHISLEVSGLALQLFLFLLHDTGEASQTLMMINDSHQLKPILNHLLYRSENPAIVRDATLLLQKFQSFSHKY